MKSTPEMRSRIRELMMDPQDDYDRAVECVLDDLEGVLSVAQTPNAPDALAALVERFSKRLLAKLRLAQANGRSGWERDDWEQACQRGLLRHIEKGDPRDVAAYCAFMDHHGWITVPAAPQPRANASRAPDTAAILNCDELHDLGFAAGWQGATEECAKLADHRASIWARDAGQPRRAVCSQPLEEECQDIAQAIRALAHPSTSRWTEA